MTDDTTPPTHTGLSEEETRAVLVLSAPFFAGAGRLGMNRKTLGQIHPGTVPAALQERVKAAGVTADTTLDTVWLLDILAVRTSEHALLHYARHAHTLDALAESPAFSEKEHEYLTALIRRRIRHRLWETNPQLHFLGYAATFIRVALALGWIEMPQALALLKPVAQLSLPHLAQVHSWQDLAEMMVVPAEVQHWRWVPMLRRGGRRLCRRGGQIWPGRGPDHSPAQQRLAASLGPVRTPVPHTPDDPALAHIVTLASDAQWDEALPLLHHYIASGPQARQRALAALGSRAIAPVAALELEGWHEKDSLALCLHAQWMLDYAYDARGSDVASRVGAENFRLFDERLQQTLALVIQGLEKHPDQPDFVRMLFAIEPHIRSPELNDARARAQELFDSKFFDHFPTLRVLLNFKLAKWGGGSELSFRFARDAAARAPDKPELHALVFIAACEAELIENDFSLVSIRESKILQDEALKAELQQRFAECIPHLHDFPGAALSAILFWFWRQGDLERFATAAGALDEYTDFGLIWQYFYDDAELDVLKVNIARFGWAAATAAALAQVEEGQGVSAPPM